MEQPIATRIFPLDCVVDARWTVNNNPHRFPNVRSSEYTPVNIEDGTINIDVRRTNQNSLLPELDTLTKLLNDNTTDPIALTISWKAVAFLSSPSGVPPWTKPTGPDIHPGSIEKLKPYFELLTCHIHRWKAFRIFCPLVIHLKPKITAYMLESLIVMDVERSAEINGLAQILSPLREYTQNVRELQILDNRVRDVVFDGFDKSLEFDESSTSKPSPFSINRHFRFSCYDRLTCLRVDYPLTVVGAWSLLKKGNHLVQCVFDGLTGATPPIEQTVTCSSLEYLELSNYRGDYRNYKTTGSLHALLATISTPNLKQLILKCEDKWDAAAFSTFITQSSCTLDSLHIIKMGIDAEGLVSCLELAGDSLTDLLLQGRNQEIQLGNHLFTKLLGYEDPRHHDRARACLCPKLKVISISDLSFDGSGEFGLVLGTRVGVTPLSEVRILCSDEGWRGTNLQKADVEKLQALEKKGIQVHLSREACDGL